MKPGTLVKLRSDQSDVYNGVLHNGSAWRDRRWWSFNVSHEHVGMYIKTYKRNELIVNDIILIEDRLIEVDRGVMVPLKIED